jgi:hypothetical protein
MNKIMRSVEDISRKCLLLVGPVRTLQKKKNSRRNNGFHSILPENQLCRNPEVIHFFSIDLLKRLTLPTCGSNPGKKSFDATHHSPGGLYRIDSRLTGRLSTRIRSKNIFHQAEIHRSRKMFP